MVYCTFRGRCVMAIIVVGGVDKVWTKFGQPPFQDLALGFKQPSPDIIKIYRVWIEMKHTGFHLSCPLSVDSIWSIPDYSSHESFNNPQWLLSNCWKLGLGLLTLSKATVHLGSAPRSLKILALRCKPNQILGSLSVSDDMYMYTAQIMKVSSRLY